LTGFVEKKTTKKTQPIQTTQRINKPTTWLEILLSDLPELLITERGRRVYNSRVSWNFRTFLSSLILDLWGNSSTLTSWKG